MRSSSLNQLGSSILKSLGSSSLKTLWSYSLKSLWSSSLKPLLSSSIKFVWSSSLKSLWILSLKSLWSSNIKILWSSSLKSLWSSPQPWSQQFRAAGPAWIWVSCRNVKRDFLFYDTLISYTYIKFYDDYLSTYLWNMKRPFITGDTIPSNPLCSFSAP